MGCGKLFKDPEWYKECGELEGDEPVLCTECGVNMNLWKKNNDQ